MKIREIFEKPINRRIEEVVKVTQDDESVVSNEINEYVVTDAIKDHYIKILREFCDALSSPHEGIGVWVSGFFGSGKSSFAKILGYMLEGRKLKGENAAKLFSDQANDKEVSDYLDYIKARIPTKSIIFDISMDRGVRINPDMITEIIYRNLLKELDYAEDFDIAKLEQDLEAEGILEDFINLYEKTYKKKWSKGRKRILALNEASNVMHLMDSRTYNQPDSWAKAITSKDENGNTKGRADITPKELARLVFELTYRRKGKCSIVFIIDEVGQFISRSVQKMLDLQAFVEALGVEGRNRVTRKEAIAPAWLVVTSQEKLNEVVSALDDKKIELARLKDRFPIEIDLSPADISEVTSKRILTKKASIIPELGKLYDDNKNRLNQCVKLERTSRDCEVRRDEFIKLYPYIPYHIDLCIDIMSGIRLEPGATRHIGGSNRTIIKQAQQMLVNPKVKLAEKEVGSLVTLDKVYNLIEGSLSSEKQKDIYSIIKNFADDAMVISVAKTICLLEYVRDLPRTVNNISAVLYPEVGDDFNKSDVESAIKKLENAQLIKFSDQGYKLLTAQEKNWDIERKELSPRQAEINLIKKELLEEIFRDSKITNFNYMGLKTFKFGFFYEDSNLSDSGDIVFEITTADNLEEYKEIVELKKKISREQNDQIFSIILQSEEMYKLVLELFKSREMINRRERLASAGKLIDVEIKCFDDEKRKRDKVRRMLKSEIIKSIYSSTILFRGIKKDVQSEGKDLYESIKKIVNKFIPQLFPKFEMGAKKVTGKEPEKILTADNLEGLPNVFYGGSSGLNLVAKRGGKYVINKDAEIAIEISKFLRDKNEIEGPANGKTIENNFSGIGFGWDRDILRIVIATLFRAGDIEIGFRGSRYKDYSNPEAREAIINNNSFKIATFIPRTITIKFKDVKEACENLQNIKGKEIDADINRISEELKELLVNKKDDMLELKGAVNAYNLPAKEFIGEIFDTILNLQKADSEDCVKILASEGKEFGDNLEKVEKIKLAVSDYNLDKLINAKKVLSQVVPDLTYFFIDDESLKQNIKILNQSLQSEDFYNRISDISKKTEEIVSIYNDLYKEKHKKRYELYDRLKEKIKGMEDWANLPDETKNEVIKEIDSKCCENVNFNKLFVCSKCNSNSREIELDINLLSVVENKAMGKVYDFIGESGNKKIERIRISEYFPRQMHSLDEFKEKMDKFSEDVNSFLKDGIEVIIDWS